MEDLIYAGSDVEKTIKTKYPQSKIKDASDYIHTERFELELDGVDEEDFYPFAIAEGFASFCLRVCFLLESLKFKDGTAGLKHEETISKLERWLEKTKSIKGVLGNGKTELDVQR